MNFSVIECSIQFINVPLKAFWVLFSRAVYVLFIAATGSRDARRGNCDRSIWIEFGGLPSGDPYLRSNHFARSGFNSCSLD